MKDIQLAFARPIEIPKALNEILGISAFTLLVFLAAFVRIPLPFTPVPLTLQTLAVLLSAGWLGRKAVYSQALYLVLGAAGLPVFQGTAGGVAHLLGPTGGYLAGFVLASCLAGWAMEKPRGILITALTMATASLLILALGSLWLGVLLKLSPLRAIELGVVPFFAGDLVKSGLAALVLWGWRRR